MKQPGQNYWLHDRGLRILLAATFSVCRPPVFLAWCCGLLATSGKVYDRVAPLERSEASQYVGFQALHNQDSQVPDQQTSAEEAVCKFQHDNVLRTSCIERLPLRSHQHHLRA